MTETITINDDAQIAMTILQQLGGPGRVRAMTGAKDFIRCKGGALQFRFPNRLRSKANLVRIELDKGTDTYIVSFSRISTGRKFCLKDLSRHEQIHADQLKGLFESQTGLYLSL